MPGFEHSHYHVDRSEIERFCKNSIYWDPEDIVELTGKKVKITEEGKQLRNYTHYVYGKGVPELETTTNDGQIDDEKREREETNEFEIKPSGKIGAEVDKVSAEAKVEGGFRHQNQKKSADNRTSTRGYVRKEKTGGGDLQPHTGLDERPTIAKRIVGYKVPVRAKADVKLGIKLKALTSTAVKTWVGEAIGSFFFVGPYIGAEVFGGDPDGWSRDDEHIKAADIFEYFSLEGCRHKPHGIVEAVITIKDDFVFHGHEGIVRTV